MNYLLKAQVLSKFLEYQVLEDELLFNLFQDHPKGLIKREINELRALGHKIQDGKNIFGRHYYIYRAHGNGERKAYAHSSKSN